MEAQAIAYTANYAGVVFKILIECLEKNGALLPGQVQKALRATLGHPKAELNRLDFVFLADLLSQLDATAGRVISGKTNLKSQVPAAMCAMGQKLTRTSGSGVFALPLKTGPTHRGRQGANSGHRGTLMEAGLSRLAPERSACGEHGE